MGIPQFSMHDLMEAGVHFGHKTKRWNPRMAPFIYGVRADIHIIHLGKTAPMLRTALAALRDVVSQNGRILFVGTKRQAAEPIAEAAKRCGQHYINQRWLGGLLTNWNTIQASIRRLHRLDEQLAGTNQGFTKKELLSMRRERDKLEASLGGIKEMGGRPDMLFVIDTGKEDLAVKEARRLGIPIVAIVDSNCSADGITYPVPGNDDSTRAIQLYCRLVSDAVLDGIQASVTKSGVDLGAREDAAEVLSLTAAVSESEGHETPKKEGRARPGRASAKKAPMVTVKKTPGKKAAE